MGSTHQYGIDLSGLRWLSVVSVEVAEAFVNFSEKLAWPISQQAAKASIRTFPKILFAG